MRHSDWCMFEKWRGVDTPMGGWLYNDPGKWRMIFILELVPYENWRKKWGKKHLLIHSSLSHKHHHLRHKLLDNCLPSVSVVPHYFSTSGAVEDYANACDGRCAQDCWLDTQEINSFDIWFSDNQLIPVVDVSDFIAEHTHTHTYIPSDTMRQVSVVFNRNSKHCDRMFFPL